MTVISLELNATQLSRFNSTDTVSEMCINLCGKILEYLTDSLDSNPVLANRINTLSIMIKWYIGILSRACSEDPMYKGTPRVTTVYIEKNELSKEHTVRHAFTARTLDTVPTYLLVELVHKIIHDIVKCLIPSIITMTTDMVYKYDAKLSELLKDLSETLDLSPARVSEYNFSTVMIRVHLPDDSLKVLDFI